MNRFSSKQLKRILLAICLIIIIVAAYYAYSLTKFRLVGTDPSLGKITVAQTSLSLNFNKPLSPDRLVIDAMPSNISSDRVAGKTLVINFSQLGTAPYTINILKLYDTKGAQINNLAIHFTPSDTAFEKLPSGTQQNIVNSQQNQNQVTTPLSSLPYDGSDYELTLQYPQSASALPTIEFTYVPNAYDTFEGPPAEQNAVNNAKAWLATKGISLSTYSLVDSSTGQAL